MPHQPPRVTAILSLIGTACISTAGTASVAAPQPGSEGWPANSGTANAATRPTDPATAQELDQLLAQMSHAILSQDTDGYMTFVSTADPEFRNEQLYFAKDFAKAGKATKECAITLDHDSLDIGDGSVFGTITFTWTQTPAAESEKEPKERSMTLSARFDREDGAWKYAGERWHKHEAPGVLVLFDEGLDEAAAAVAEAFTTIRPGVEEAFGLTQTQFPTRTKSIKLYASMKHLQQSICLSYESGLSGWNEPGEALKILVGKGEQTPARFLSVLAHEYGHCATFELGKKSNDMPWWILEGVADLMVEQVDDNARDRMNKSVARWSKTGKLANWNDLADFEKVPGNLTRFVYTQGHGMLAYISDTWGATGRNRWMTLMSNGKTIDEASQEVMGMSFADLDAKWRATLPPREPDEEEHKDAAPAKDKGGN